MLSVQVSMQSIYVRVVIIIITSNNKKHIQLHTTLYKHTNCNIKDLIKKASGGTNTSMTWSWYYLLPSITINNSFPTIFSINGIPSWW